MRVKYEDNSSEWNEDNGAMVADNVTIGQHAKQTVDKYNKQLKPNQKKMVFIVARTLPLFPNAPYLNPIK